MLSTSRGAIYCTESQQEAGLLFKGRHNNNADTHNLEIQRTEDIELNVYFVCTNFLVFDTSRNRFKGMISTFYRLFTKENNVRILIANDTETL
jgi:hypothetical protein